MLFRSPKAGEAIRDYFTEVLHPISIILGKGYTGNANEGIEKIIIKEKLVNSDNIQYSMKTNEPIVDSSIIHKNRSVNISSKGGKGGRGAPHRHRRETEGQDGDRDREGRRPRHRQEHRLGGPAM